MTNTSVNFLGIEFKNPVLTASGTFNSGKEFSSFIDLNRLGGITVKGVSAVPWEGNKPPRIAETHGGMLNSVGLQNPGIDSFIKEDIPFLRQFDTKIIVNLCGHTLEEYIDVAKKIKGQDIDLVELNVSCPNLSSGGITFGTSPKDVFEVVSKVKKEIDVPLVVKLTPNVTSIEEIAIACENAGADGLSLINTLIGMKIDIYKRKTVLKNRVGGLSGPPIKPVALSMVNKVFKAVKIPIIGMGGISNFEDAIEFIMAGASLVSIGTANFTNPFVTIEIIEGIERFMKENKINNLTEIVGIV